MTFNISLSFFVNGSSKESKPSEAHPRIFFLSLLLLPMTRVNPIELFFTDSFFFFSSSKSPCGNLDYLTGLFEWSDVVELETQEKKFDCDNYSWRKTRKTKRTCWQVWIFITLTRWLSTMMRKDFRLSFSVLSSRRFAWNPEMQNLSSSKKFIRRFRKLFSTTLYLFLGGWWQIFILLDARSQLLEVIFLLVQAEAQYNSVTINNISTVGVVKWGSSIFVLWCRKPWRASVTSESRTSSSPTRARWIFGGSFTKRYRECSSGH